MPLIHLNRCNLKRRLGLNGHSLWAILVALVYAYGLAGCGDISNVSPPPAGPGPLTIVTNSPLPSGTVNQPYATALGGSGGITPYTWSLASSSPALPAGLFLDATAGTITGTPTTTGTTTPIFRLEDSSSPEQSCTKIADDHDHDDPTAADDYDLIAPGGGCEPALPSHNLAGDGWNPTLYVVGKPRIAERIAVQCAFAGHDQRHSIKRNGGHDNTYVHGL